MTLTATAPSWTADTDYRTEWAETSDPRIVAVIARDAEPSAPYGDALCPAYYVETRGYATRTDRAGEVYHDDESDALASLWADARDRAPHRRDRDEFAARVLRAFHDTRAVSFSGGYQRKTTILLLDTPAYRAHVGRDTSPTGATIHTTWTDDELFAGERGEWVAYLDGEVYGIGYATLPERVTTETPIPDDLAGWDVEIECWGFYGETYAKETALTFEHGAPALPAMLAL
ncbi:hypothetical protein MRBLMI12_000455 [Microbacterium sp. LMI12-1-1.1]|uniref:hypothetical protein n=1 Tax=Microbacterium sp. LMI12-1-1.1 TaxID=3135225 RepID=UPI0034314871